MLVCEFLFIFFVIKRNFYLFVNLIFVGLSMWVIGGFRRNVGMWSFYNCFLY